MTIAGIWRQLEWSKVSHILLDKVSLVKLLRRYLFLVVLFQLLDVQSQIFIAEYPMQALR